MMNCTGPISFILIMCLSVLAIIGGIFLGKHDIRKENSVIARLDALEEAAISRPIEPLESETKRMHMVVTAYCPGPCCCGEWADGYTASGASIKTNGGCFVAAPRWLPVGSLVRIPGYADGRPVPVLDRGGAITDDRLDVFFASHQEAQAWGRRIILVEILKFSP